MALEFERCLMWEMLVILGTTLSSSLACNVRTHASYQQSAVKISLPEAKRHACSHAEAFIQWSMKEGRISHLPFIRGLV